MRAKSKATEDYSNPWLYQDIIFESEMIEDNYGFVYLITDLETNKKYIGRKYFWAMRTPKGKTRRQKSESDWKKYYSSHEEIKTIGKKKGFLGRFYLIATTAQFLWHMTT